MKKILYDLVAHDQIIKLLEFEYGRTLEWDVWCQIVHRHSVSIFENRIQAELKKDVTHFLSEL